MSRDIPLRMAASVIIIILMFTLHRAITVGPRPERAALAVPSPWVLAPGAVAGPETDIPVWDVWLDGKGVIVAGSFGGTTGTPLTALLADRRDRVLMLNLVDERPQAVERLVAAILATDAGARVIVAGSDERSLQRFRRRAPDVATVAGPGETRVFYLLQKLGLRRLHRAHADLYLVPPSRGWQRFDDPGFLRQAHALNQKVVFIVGDDPAEMRRLLTLGADGIFTNRPDLVEMVTGDW
ncbi:MAG: hypothetical protein RMN24_01160 [Anaerolineae bacterium]|nr:hypothetical protein [Caldilineales bacterium]MCX7852367.1 hypothetical protein [Caldilineales bacterium]MDW8267747.1 hypothetical protein [Anaerolineae bacterium]